MIESLALTDLGVVASAEISLAPGLTVITGETGAGKTMILTGLGLLWGERADPQRVRAGADQSRVDGVVRVSDPVLREVLDVVLNEAGADWDGDDLLISRVVTGEGRSRAYLGGRQVPAAVLSRIAEKLVTVHGQDDQFRLLQGSQQRQALDTFAGATMQNALGRYREHYVQLRDAIRARQELAQQSADHTSRQFEIRGLLNEVDNLAPSANESAALAAQAATLRHAEGIAAAAHEALEQLRGDGEGNTALSADHRLAAARAALARVEMHHEGLKGVNGDLATIQQQLDEAGLTLASLGANLKSDPQQLATIEERRAALATVLRHFAAHTETSSPTEADMLEWAAQARAQIETMDGAGELMGRLDADIARLREESSLAAAELTRIRSEQAGVLGKLVTQEMTALAMPRARLEVTVTPRPPGEGLILTVNGQTVSADSSGSDDVAFGFATRPEESARPLHRGVSGGERSRIMLALEVVLAEGGRVPTMIFDEVDAGIGGRAAIEVGRRLARLAQHAQVIVVTHLPQVAAFGSAHIVVSSDAQGQVTAASVQVVDAEDRQRELARMLSGLSDSESGVVHAQELLDLANAESSGAPERREPMPRAR
ncbi:MAG: DNA repair protein RecN [Candidatus Nanopelagicales bacterium]